MRVIDEIQAVEVAWDSMIREFKWGSIVWGNAENVQRPVVRVPPSQSHSK